MSYVLGIDLGTSVTSAAVYRTGEGGGAPEIVPLDAGRVGVASVLYLAEDGSFLVGAAAEQQVLTDPDRVFRHFKRRIGGDPPDGAGDQAHTPEDLAARMVRWVVDRVTEREGEAPERIAVTHPATWGQHQLQLLTEALRKVGVDDPTFVTEPEAAAASRAAAAPVDIGSTIGVFDFGGGSFDAAVVRKAAPGAFTVLGTPLEMDSLCGADFEEAMFTHVLAELGDGVGTADLNGPEIMASIAQLLETCVEAKEALSTEAEVTIPVRLPGMQQSQLQLTRRDLESLIRPALQETVHTMCTAMWSDQVRLEDLDEVLLVGGSSQVPLVARVVSAELRSPVTVLPEAQAAVALGAALAAFPEREYVPSPVAVPPVVAVPPDLPDTLNTSWEEFPPVPPAVDTAPQPALRRQTGQRLAAAAAGVVAVAAVLVPLTIMGSTDSPPPTARDAPLDARTTSARPLPGGLLEKPRSNAVPAPVIAPPATSVITTSNGRTSRGVVPATRPPAPEAPPPAVAPPPANRPPANP
ncbi:MAG: Hsp70 family protein, partial [Pseudonocardiaceae bacterium]